MSGSIHVISPVAGFGNRLDLELVASLLEESGFNVTRYPVVDRSKAGRSGRVALQVLKFAGRFDVNLFLAPIFPEWLPMAKKNILIPNAEGFADHLRKWLPRMDLVLAKTHLTARVFGEQGCKTEYISFTSEDHLDESVPRDRRKFLHTCSSQFKGTQAVLDTWLKHPEWPELVAIVNHNDKIPADISAPNMRIHRERVKFEELKRLQNECVFHICCSEAEGFGHYIMEAMSCRAVTLTTNAPPMNELVTPGRGLLVDVKDESKPMALSRAYFIKPESLEAEVERALRLSDAEIQQMGEAAREFFVLNDRFFRKHFVEVMRSVIQ